MSGREMASCVACRGGKGGRDRTDEKWGTRDPEPGRRWLQTPARARARARNPGLSSSSSLPLFLSSSPAAARSANRRAPPSRCPRACWAARGEGVTHDLKRVHAAQAQVARRKRGPWGNYDDDPESPFVGVRRY